jgi:acetamidase/formamidase
VRKDYPVQAPQLVTAGPLNPHANIAPYYATTGVGPDLMEATRDAVRQMIAHLERRYGLSHTDAYMLCSVAVDLKICEVVDAPHWVVGAFLPESLFASE